MYDTLTGSSPLLIIFTFCIIIYVLHGNHGDIALQLRPISNHKVTFLPLIRNHKYSIVTGPGKINLVGALIYFEKYQFGILNAT